MEMVEMNGTEMSKRAEERKEGAAHLCELSALLMSAHAAGDTEIKLQM